MPVPIQNVTFTASIANGVTTTFPFSFMIGAAEDLAVTINGSPVLTGFTVTGAGNPAGGSIEFVTPPAAGAKVLRYLNPLLKRDTDYQQFGDWNADIVDLDFDRIWLAIQSVSQGRSRAIKLPIDTAQDQTITAEPAARAAKLVGFDGDGNVTVVVPADIPVAVVTGFIATLLDDADAAAARETLEIPKCIQEQTLSAFTTAGAAPAFTVSTSPAYGALAAGQRMRVKFHAPGGAAPTLNRDGTGPKSLVQYDASGAKVAAVIAAGMLADVEYDGTDYVLASASLGRGATHVAAVVLSASAVDLLGIPANCKKITLNFNSVSWSAVAPNLRLQLGTSGDGVDMSSTYEGAFAAITSANAVGWQGLFSTGFDLMPLNNAGDTVNGSVTLTRSDNYWMLSGLLQRTGVSVGVLSLSAGKKQLAGALDRLRITLSGVGTFDSGSVNVIWEA